MSDTSSQLEGMNDSEQEENPWIDVEEGSKNIEHSENNSSLSSDEGEDDGLDVLWNGIDDSTGGMTDAEEQEGLQKGSGSVSGNDAYETAIDFSSENEEEGDPIDAAKVWAKANPEEVTLEIIGVSKDTEAMSLQNYEAEAAAGGEEHNDRAQYDENETVLRSLAEKCRKYYRKHSGWGERFFNWMRRMFSFIPTVDAPRGRLFKEKRKIARTFRSYAYIEALLKSDKSDNKAGKVASPSAALNEPQVPADKTEMSKDHAGDTPPEQVDKVFSIQDVQTVVDKIKAQFEKSLKACLRESKTFKAWTLNDSDEGAVQKMKDKAQTFIGDFATEIIVKGNTQGSQQTPVQYAENIANELMVEAQASLSRDR